MTVNEIMRGRGQRQWKTVTAFDVIHNNAPAKLIIVRVGGEVSDISEIPVPIYSQLPTRREHHHTRARQPLKLTQRIGVLASN
jgi:hypothetical protein